MLVKWLLALGPKPGKADRVTLPLLDSALEMISYRERRVLELRYGIGVHPAKSRLPRSGGCARWSSTDSYSNEAKALRLVQRRSLGLKRRAANADRSDVFDVGAALRSLVERGGSDLHLKVGSPPLGRINGVLTPLPDEPPLSEADTEAALQAVIGDESKRREFAEENEADFSFEIDGVSRFRVNAYRARGRISLAIRAIPNRIRTIDELKLPPVVKELAEEERGIILLTGTTGSGKSTTLAAMIDHINATLSKHIVTIEDPIEYVHQDKRSVINQREVGMDTASFGRAMRRVLRQDPDVILIGEMRDEETVRAALSAAETGHLVLSTVHTLDAAESINRILDFFPPHQHAQARSMIAGTLKGVISQRLVRSKDGGRIAVCEILRMTGRVHDMIKDPEQINKLRDVIFSGSYYGMQTFDQALFKHLKAGLVTFEDAIRVATSPHDFKLLVEADGKRGTTMEDVKRAQEQGGGRTPAPPRQPSQPAAATPAPAPAGPPGNGAPAAPAQGAGIHPGVASPAAPSPGVHPGVAAPAAPANGLHAGVAAPFPPTTGLQAGVANPTTAQRAAAAATGMQPGVAAPAGSPLPGGVVGVALQEGPPSGLSFGVNPAYNHQPTNRPTG